MADSVETSVQQANGIPQASQEQSELEDMQVVHITHPWGKPCHSRSPLEDSTHSNLILLSPNGARADAYPYPFLVTETGFNPRDELLETISLMVQEAPLREYYEDRTFHKLLNQCKNSSTPTFEELNDVCQRYNHGIRCYLADCKDKPERFHGSTELIQHMINMVYNRAISDPTRLNRYKGWTEEVYGEFSSSMISELVRRVPILPGHKFIDLGSGVGQVVLQVAAEAQCVSCFGIEKQDTPAAYAKVMSAVFADRCNYLGLKHGPFEIVQGDFLEDSILEKINEADVIFVNNFAFGAVLNQVLKERFENAKENAKIVSSLNFRPLSFTITDRNLTDISTILTVEKVTSTGQGVSWTSRPFDYFIHTVDRSMLEEYFKQGALGRQGGSSRRAAIAPAESPKTLAQGVKSDKQTDSQTQQRRSKKDSDASVLEDSQTSPENTLDVSDQTKALFQSTAVQLNRFFDDCSPNRSTIIASTKEAIDAYQTDTKSKKQQLMRLQAENAKLERLLKVKIRAQRGGHGVQSGASAAAIDAAESAALSSLQDLHALVDETKKCEELRRRRAELETEVEELTAKRTKLLAMQPEVEANQRVLATWNTLAHMFKLDRGMSLSDVISGQPQSLRNLYSVVMNKAQPLLSDIGRNGSFSDSCSQGSVNSLLADVSQRHSTLTPPSPSEQVKIALLKNESNDSAINMSVCHVHVNGTNGTHASIPEVSEFESEVDLVAEAPARRLNSTPPNILRDNAVAPHAL